VPKLETRVRKVPISRLERLPENPRYMTSLQSERLTQNIKRDGALTSLPLVYDLIGDDSGPLLVLSGNHRVDAAEAAGLTEIDVVEIITRIDDDRRRAIALSHNAIVGQDDPNRLRAFYESLSLALKEYTGLTEDSFKVPTLDIAALSVRPPLFEQMVVDFLPQSAEIFREALKRIKAGTVPPTVLVGRFEDFDAFFEATMRTKKQTNVHNAAMALRMMAELAIERLDQIEGAGDREV